MRVLVTGGTGSLGRSLARAVAGAGHVARVMSRRARAVAEEDGVEWARADIAEGDGVRAAVERVDAVIHAATDPRRAEAVDVRGTRHLVEAARAARVGHFVHVSIVGIDEIPLGYYGSKLAAERIVAESGLPHTTLRATQFHSLVAGFISKAARVPVLLPLPTDFKFQSVAESEVAVRLVGCLDEGARGRVEDLGGPEVLALGEMAAGWMEAKGVRKKLVRLPLPGAVAAAFRAGRNTAPHGARGSIRWRDWLADSSTVDDG